MGFLKNIFRPRDKPSSSGNFLFGSTASGKVVTEKSAMQSTVVYACVRILSETVASLPLHTYKYTDIGKEKALDHPLYFLLHNAPNNEMTSFVYRETIMTHLLLWGNSYTQIIRDGRGRVLELYPLMPDKMVVSRADTGELYYTYRTQNGDITLTSDEVLHIAGLGFDGILGYSPIAMAKNSIGLGLAVEEFGSKLFSNGASPSGVLEYPGTLKDPKKIRESWNQVYAGSGNAHKICVLEDGMKFTKISINPNEAQFLETRKFQTEEICRIFRVPPHLVASLENATFSNIENQSISFVIHTIRPWLVRIEQAINIALFSKKEQKEYFVSFLVDGLLRGDYASRMQGYSIAIQNGFLSPNDVRTLENLNKVENGDVYAMNGNMIKLEDIGVWKEKYKNGSDN